MKAEEKEDDTFWSTFLPKGREKGGSRGGLGGRCVWLGGGDGYPVSVHDCSRFAVYENGGGTRPTTQNRGNELLVAAPSRRHTLFPTICRQTAATCSTKNAPLYNIERLHDVISFYAISTVDNFNLLHFQPSPISTYTNFGPFVLNPPPPEHCVSNPPFPTF